MNELVENLRRVAAMKGASRWYGYSLLSDAAYEIERLERALCHAQLALGEGEWTAASDAIFDALRVPATGSRESVIERSFKVGRFDHIDAVLRLESLGYSPEDADRKVHEWTAAPEVIGQDGSRHPF